MQMTRESTRSLGTLSPHLDRGFRPDIEGLRALAVVVVVLFHARFFGLDGGFVGVDVFFVVSGFLITRLLLGELAATGTIALAAFWGRRARRLLPASALTVVATVIAGHWLLAPLTQDLLVRDVVGAATFTSNVVFADRLGDYFGAQLGAATPSPLLHFWSLAVEEQFYLCWPLLLVVLTRRPRQYRRLLLLVVGAVAVAGTALAAWLTPRQPAWAFYFLPARMGELAAGALLAVVGSQVRVVPASWRAAGAWAGLVVVLGAAFRFDEGMPWPGTAVLVPVVATMAVIAGGDTLAGPRRVLGVPLLQWIGRHSYALYLWHWPVLVLADAEWGPLDWQQRGAAVATSVGLATLSVQFLEDPVRHARILTADAWRSLAMGAAMVLVVVASAWGLQATRPPLDSGETADAPELVIAGAPAVPGPGSTTLAPLPVPTTIAVPVAAGPTTIVSGVDVPSTIAASTSSTSTSSTSTTTTLAVPEPPTGVLAELTVALQTTLTDASTPAVGVPANLRPSLARSRDRSRPYSDGCVNVGVNVELQPCRYGVPGDGAPLILLHGDSKAVQWFEPVEQIALERGFELVLLTKAGCPVSDVVVPTPVLRHTCPPYRDRVIRWIAEQRPSVVIVAESYTQYEDDAATWAAGALATFARLAEVSRNVVILGDTPASTVDPPACLSDHVDDAMACATPRATAVRSDRIAGELVAARTHGFTFVDTSDWLCTATTCPPVVGDLLVRRDETHLTVPMAEFLRPLVEAAISPALDRAVEG